MAVSSMTSHWARLAPVARETANSSSRRSATAASLPHTNPARAAASGAPKSARHGAHLCDVPGTVGDPHQVKTPKERSSINQAPDALQHRRREVAVVTLKNRFDVTEAEVIRKHWAP
jgi:hypothetical protein